MFSPTYFGVIRTNSVTSVRAWVEDVISIYSEAKGELSLVPPAKSRQTSHLAGLGCQCVPHPHAQKRGRFAAFFLAQTYFPCACFLTLLQNIIQHFLTGSFLPCLWCCFRYSTSKALHNRRQQVVDPTGPRRTRAPSWKTCWLPRSFQLRTRPSADSALSQCRSRAILGSDNNLSTAHESVVHQEMVTLCVVRTCALSKCLHLGTILTPVLHNCCTTDLTSSWLYFGVHCPQW